jgi:hypothetical protein
MSEPVRRLQLLGPAAGSLLMAALRDRAPDVVLQDGAADAVLLDLAGTPPPAGRRVWRVVDDAGAALLRPGFGRHACCRAPGFLQVLLVETRDGGASWQRLGAAAPGAWRPYPELLRAAQGAALALLARALEGTEPAGAWAPRRVPADPPGRWQAAHALRRLQDKLTAEHWAVALSDATPEALLAGAPLRASVWLRATAPDGYLADPFPWPGRPGVLLCEWFDHRSGLGRLQAVTLHDGVATPAEEVEIGEAGHLSYPCAWQHEGRVLCLPEMGSSRRQNLYELVPGAPARLVATVAADVAMADPTPFQHGGRWWIAYTDTDLGPHDNLCLLHAERPEGPWQPHRANPVKVDVRSARPGGAVLRAGDALLRPAQDCATGYGAALVLNRILECTPHRYREEPVARIAPDPAGPYPHGLHHLAPMEGGLVLDGKRVAVSPRVLLHRLLRRLPLRRAAPPRRSPLHDAPTGIRLR